MGKKNDHIPQCLTTFFFPGSSQNCRPRCAVRQLVCSWLLPANPPLPRRRALAPVSLSLQLRLHVGGEWCADQPGHQSAGSVQQPSQAQSGGSQPPGGLQPDATQPGWHQPGPRKQWHRGNSSGEPSHPQEFGCHVDSLHLPEAGNHLSCRGALWNYTHTHTAVWLLLNLAWEFTCPVVHFRSWSCWIAIQKIHTWSGTMAPEPSCWSTWRVSRRGTPRGWAHHFLLLSVNVPLN